VVETRNLTDIKAKTGNLYESIAIVAKRANQINIALKEELHNKLDEFAAIRIAWKRYMKIKSRLKSQGL
jgi:DNA-directed RNA polymerase subunit K/omega